MLWCMFSCYWSASWVHVLCSVGSGAKNVQVVSYGLGCSIWFKHGCCVGMYMYSCCLHVDVSYSDCDTAVCMSYELCVVRKNMSEMYMSKSLDKRTIYSSLSKWCYVDVCFRRLSKLCIHWCRLWQPYWWC